MNSILEECRKRNITRLCHFTQSRNLAHIFGDKGGILSTKSLIYRDYPYNPSDLKRFDGRDDLICCSIEYPNSYYFFKSRKRNPLFEDWVVLYLRPDYIWNSGTFFCPCNAAKSSGNYIDKGYCSFLKMFLPKSPGSSIVRTVSHLESSPTDIQAEVLIPEPVSLDSIKGIAVESEEQAKIEILRLELQDIILDIDFFIVPKLYNRSEITRCIRNGNKILESKFEKGDCYGQRFAK